MSLPRLPLELQDLALQHLSHDRPALLRCSLVCKDWRNICAAMLFADLDLSSRPDEKPGARFKQFCDLTNALTYPPFLANVQHIKMDRDAKPKYIRALKVDRLGSFVSLCVAGTPSINAASDGDYYGAISKQFPGLKRLDLVTAFFDKRPTLLEFISSFPNLRSLALGNMKWFVFFGYQHRPVPFDAQPLPPIEHLRVSLKNMEHIDKYLLAWMGEQLQARGSLRDLEYSVLVASPPPNFNREFLQRVSSSLERMSLDFEMGLLADGMYVSHKCDCRR